MFHEYIYVEICAHQLTNTKIIEHYLSLINADGRKMPHDEPCPLPGLLNAAPLSVWPLVLFFFHHA